MKLTLTGTALALLLCAPQALNCSNTLEHEKKLTLPADELIGAAMVVGGIALGYNGLNTINEVFASLRENNHELNPHIHETELLSTAIGALFSSFGGAFLVGVGSRIFVESAGVKDFCERWSDPITYKRNQYYRRLYGSAQHEVNADTDSTPVQEQTKSTFKIQQLTDCNHCNRQNGKDETILQYACGHQYHYTCVKKTERANTFVQCGECHPAKHTKKKR